MRAAVIRDKVSPNPARRIRDVRIRETKHFPFSPFSLSCRGKKTKEEIIWRFGWRMRQLLVKAATATLSVTGNVQPTLNRLYHLKPPSPPPRLTQLFPLKEAAGLEDGHNRMFQTNWEPCESQSLEGQHKTRAHLLFKSMISCTEKTEFLNIQTWRLNENNLVPVVDVVGGGGVILLFFFSKFSMK